jgi:hypothetical protein
MGLLSALRGLLRRTPPRPVSGDDLATTINQVRTANRLPALNLNPPDLPPAPRPPGWPHAAP